MRLLIPVVALFMVFLVVSLPVCFAQEMSLSYDANGNLVTGDGKFRAYNSLNQLYRVYNGTNLSGTLLREFEYHPVEERVLVKKTYNSTGELAETVYYWSQNFVTVVNSSGSYNFTYVYHNGELVAQQNPDGSKLFVSTDHKGNVVAVTNSSGSVVERTSYGLFGDIISGGRLSRLGYEANEQEPSYGKVPTDGLISYYSLEGDALDDASKNNGAVTNAQQTSGQVRDAYYFDGSGDYIAINDSSSLDITGNLTLSAWVYPVENQAGYIVAKYQAYMIHLTGSPFVAQGGIWVSGSWNSLVSYNISLNQWTHVVFTYDRVQARLYINGLQVANYTKTSAIDTNNQILCIGAKNATTRDRDINATIDEVGVWNRALSASEVKQLYDYGATRDSLLREVDFNARHSSPELGIFTQPDTLIPNVYDPQSLNRYMFERGNPYKNKDETGHGEELIYFYSFVVGFSVSTVTYGIQHKGEGRGSNFWPYMGKGLLYGAVGGAATAATVAFIIHGGRIAAGATGVGTLGTLTRAGQFLTGASSYAFKQAIEDKPINAMDMVWSGAINTFNPISLYPGTPVSQTSLTPNTFKILGNQLFGNVAGSFQISTIANNVYSTVSALVAPRRTSGGHSYSFIEPANYPSDPQGVCAASQSGSSSSSNQQSNYYYSLFHS